MTHNTFIQLLNTLGIQANENTHELSLVPEIRVKKNDITLDVHMPKGCFDSFVVFQVEVDEVLDVVLDEEIVFNSECPFETINYLTNI